MKHLRGRGTLALTGATVLYLRVTAHQGSLGTRTLQRLSLGLPPLGLCGDRGGGSIGSEEPQIPVMSAVRRAGQDQRPPLWGPDREAHHWCIRTYSYTLPVL